MGSGLRWSLLALAAFAAGCATEPPDSSLGAEAPYVDPPRVVQFAFDLVANEVQYAGGAFHIGGGDFNCGSVEGDPLVTIQRATANVSWEPLAPSQGELHLEFLANPHLPGRVAVEGASPLKVAVDGPFAIGDGDVFQAYVGALRGTSIVAKQPFHLELTLVVVGDVRDYPSSCTVAG